MSFKTVFCLVVIAVYAGCAAPHQARAQSGDFREARAALERFEWRDASSAPGAPETGYFYGRHLLDSATPRSLHQVLITPSRDLYVLDVGLEVREANGEPYYRAHIFPNDTPQSIIDGWPAFLEFFASDIGWIILPVRLPQDRTPDAAGRITTEWTYCGACMNDSRGSGPEPYRALAGRPSGPHTFALFLASEVKNPPEAFGEAAIAMAGGVADAGIRAARQADEEQRLYGAAREAYAMLKAEYADTGLNVMRQARCGVPAFDQAPRHAGDAVAEDYEDIAEGNAEAFEDHVACVTGFLETVDFGAFGQQLARLNAREALIWEGANLPEDERLPRPTLQSEIQAQQDHLETIEQRYRDSADALQYAYADFLDNRTEAAEAERQAWIEDQVTDCIYGLGMSGNLTAHSEGYCRAQAEKGIGAAGAVGNMIGMVGTGGSGGGAGDPGALLYARPGGLPDFDLQGMMDNARAAAAGDAGALWDEGGAIRTGRAPDVAPGAFTAGSDNVPPPSRDANADHPLRASDAEARLAGLSDGAADNANGGSSGAAAAAADDHWPDVHYVTFVARDGSELFFGKSLDIPFAGATGDIVAFEPFVTSDRVCDAEGVVHAAQRAVVRVQWLFATPDQVRAFEGRIAGELLMRITPETMTGPRRADMADVKAAVGGAYEGEPVSWMAARPFRDSLAGQCRKLDWENSVEEFIPGR